MSPKDTGPDSTEVVLGPYGVPLHRFEHAWTVEDVMAFSRIGSTAAYALMRRDGAPERLNTGGAARWNALDVLAYLHGPGSSTSPSLDKATHRSPTADRAKAAPNSHTAPVRPRANRVVEPETVSREARQQRLSVFSEPRRVHERKSSR